MKSIYKFFSGKVRKTNQQFLDPNYITLVEFKKIFEYYELLGADLLERDIIRAFNMSMEPVEDEKDELR